MNTETQTLAALAVVAIAAAWLLFRALAKRKTPGCGGDCGCPTGEFKAKLQKNKADRA
jgi:cobalamin synthase